MGTIFAHRNCKGTYTNIAWTIECQYGSYKNRIIYRGITKIRKIILPVVDIVGVVDVVRVLIDVEVVVVAEIIIKI